MRRSDLILPCGLLLAGGLAVGGWWLTRDGSAETIAPPANQVGEMTSDEAVPDPSAAAQTGPTNPGQRRESTTHLLAAPQIERFAVDSQAAASAEQVVTLGRLGEAVSDAEAGLLSDDDHTAAWWLEVEAEVLARLIEAEVTGVAIPLPDGLARVEAGTAVRRGPRSRSFIGEEVGRPGSEVSLVRHEGVLFGQVARYQDGEFYEIATLADGRIVVRQLDQSVETLGCGNGLHGIGAQEGLAHDPVQGHAGGVDATRLQKADGDHIIDLVVGYSSKARQSDGGTSQIEARIINAIDRMNQAFIASGVEDGYVHLLGMVEDPDYTEPGTSSGSMSDELSDLTSSSDGDLDTVSDLGTALGADLVAFVVNKADGSAGLAYRPGRFSITARDYIRSDRLTLIHELGHNIGCDHSWGDSSFNSSAHNYGWRFKGSDGKKYRTVMAYDWGWRRIPRYGHPSRTWLGTTHGAPDGFDVADDPQADQRYAEGGLSGSTQKGFDGSNPDLGARNAEYISSRVSSTAGYRTRSTGNASPVISSASATPSTVGTTTTQLAVTASDADGDPLTYNWSIWSAPAGHGINIPSGQNPVVTFAKAGAYEFHIQVTDGKGGSASTIVDVTVVPTGTSIELTP